MGHSSSEWEKKEETMQQVMRPNKREEIISLLNRTCYCCGIIEGEEATCCLFCLLPFFEHTVYALHPLVLEYVIKGKKKRLFSPSVYDLLNQFPERDDLFYLISLDDNTLPKRKRKIEQLVKEIQDSDPPCDLLVLKYEKCVISYISMRTIQVIKQVLCSILPQQCEKLILEY